MEWTIKEVQVTTLTEEEAMVSMSLDMLYIKLAPYKRDLRLSKDMLLLIDAWLCDLEFRTCNNLYDVDMHLYKLNMINQLASIAYKGAYDTAVSRIIRFIIKRA